MQSYIEKFVLFVMRPDGSLDVQLWAGDPDVIGKIYKARIPIPEDLLSKNPDCAQLNELSTKEV